MTDELQQNALPTDINMFQRLQTMDWSATPMGPLSDWPQSLKATIRTLMASRYPMILLWGEELIQIYNDAYTGLIGSKHPFAFGRSIKETQAESWETIGPMIHHVISTGISNWVPAQLLAVNRSGFNEETYFSLSYSAVEDDAGSIKGMLCVCSEVTQQILGERRLRIQRDLGAKAGEIRSVGKVCADIITTIDDYPNDIPFMMLYLVGSDNKLNLCNSVGIDKDVESSGDPWFLKDALQGTVTVRHHTSHLVSVNRGLWGDEVEQSITIPIASSLPGQPIGVLVAGISPNCVFDENYRSFFNLVTDQISIALRNALAYEEEKRKADELAELDRAKTSFFSNISHEFRTPLTLMLGPLEDLLSKNAVHEEYKPELQIAYQNAIRLLKLVNALLDFSRIEAGRIQASYTLTDLGQLTAELASSFESAMMKASLEYTVNCPLLQQSVYVDREMWEKIVFNLISNALKFTLEGGIHVTVEEQDTQVLFIVEDSGVGIPEHEIPNIFKRFHRINNSRSRSHEGTGIGLALTKELVNLQGGTIAVNTKEGIGTTFTVTIPKGIAHLERERINVSGPDMGQMILRKSYTNEAQLWTEAIPSTGGLRVPARAEAHDGIQILVVDDNIQMLNYLERVLCEHWQVATARNGKQALEAISRRIPDLILSDVMMPNMNGFELLKEVRNNVAWSNIPVILLSARAGAEATIEGLAKNANDYIVKPFQAQELIARISTQLEIKYARIDNTILRESENKFRRLTQLLPEKVWITDNQGNIVFGNSSLSDYTGLHGNEWNNWKFVHPDDINHSMQVWNDANAKKTPYEIECRFLRRDGEYRWHLTRAVPETDDLGKIIQWIGTSIDIHDKKLFVEELERLVDQRTRDLQRINNELEQFAYAASHDLQEPLRRAGVFATQLIGRIEPNNRLAIQLAERIASSCDRMRALVKDILDFSKLSETEIKFGKVDLNDIIKGVLTDYEILIKQKDATVTIDNLPLINGMASQMTQLFHNLLGNALKFTTIDRQPVITVKAHALSETQKHQFPTLLKERDYYSVEVSDNGVGFDEAYAQQIFTVFKRLHSKSEYEGSGIGLSLCKKIVENHNGFITATSELGKGSKFCVYLPC